MVAINQKIDNAALAAARRKFTLNSINRIDKLCGFPSAKTNPNYVTSIWNWREVHIRSPNLWEEVGSIFLSLDPGVGGNTLLQVRVRT